MPEIEARDEVTQELFVTTVASMVAAFFQNNVVPVADVPSVITMFADETTKLMDISVSGNKQPEEPVVEKIPPFCSVRKSITPDYLISLFDGRRFKSLKRYLRTTHDMTPDEYRTYFNLPSDYPMVAPNYAAKRSELAKSIGLGRGGRQPAKTTKTGSAKPAARRVAASKAPAPAPAE